VDRYLLNLIRATGKLWPSRHDEMTAAKLIESAPPFDPRALLDITVVQGVTPQVARAVAPLAARGPDESVATFLELARGYLADRDAYLERVLADLATFAEAAERAALPFLVVKGASVRHLYPADSQRLMADVDLLIGPDAAWSAMQLLGELGYHPRRLRLEAFPYAGLRDGAYGIAQMDWEGALEDPFDLHLGVFPGCGDVALETDVWRGAADVPTLGRGVRAPSVEDCILLMCAHLSRHGSAKLRDLNDLHAWMRAKGDELDWDHLEAEARRNGLSGILYSLLEHLDRERMVEIPPHTLRRFDPGRVARSLSGSFLRVGSERDPDFEHSRRQFFAGRFMQASVLHAYLRARTSGRRAATEAFSGLFHLFKEGRPYRLWHTRAPRRLERDRRLVAVQLRLAGDGGRWRLRDVALERVLEHARTRGIRAAPIAHGVVAWDAEGPDELLITSCGVFAQTPYHGELDEPARQALEASAWARVTELQAAGGLTLIPADRS
jgi:hypothetical protein